MIKNKNNAGVIFTDLMSGRFLGHPIHIILVHFPIAFLPLSAILDLMSLLNQSSYFAELGFYSGVTGVITGVFASFFGAVDLMRIKGNQMLLQKALTHGGLNLLSIMMFAVTAGMKYKHLPFFEIANIWVVIIEFIAAAIIMSSNYLGGELVLRYGVGTRTEKNIS